MLLPLTSFAANGGDSWRKLSPKDKEQIQQNYQRWQNLSPRDKDHLREEWNRWQSLPQDRREQLKRRYEDMRRHPKE